MAEVRQRVHAQHDQQTSTDVDANLRTLLARSIEAFDPAGFRHIESLARRRLQVNAPTRTVLDRTLQKAINTYLKRYDLAAIECCDHLAYIKHHHPQAAAQAQAYFEQANFANVRHLRRQHEHCDGLTALKTLTDALQQPAPLTNDDAVATLSFEAALDRQEQTALAGSAWGTSAFGAGSAQELKTVQLFKATWAKLSTTKRVTHVIESAPKGAGPLNSQTLVIRSLATLQTISPEYLSRFVTYTDTLLWLEKASGKPEPSAEKTATKSKGKEREKAKEKVKGKTGRAS